MVRIREAWGSHSQSSLSSSLTHSQRLRKRERKSMLSLAYRCVVGRLDWCSPEKNVVEMLLDFQHKYNINVSVYFLLLFDCGELDPKTIRQINNCLSVVSFRVCACVQA